MILKRYIEIQVKNHSYFLFFFCIGLFLNFDFNSTDVCELHSSNISFASTTVQQKTVNSPSITVSQKSTKKLIRPRYYSTELGIREKLFVGVITSPEQIEDRTIAINKTLSHLVDKIKYFMSAYKFKSSTYTLGNIVGFTDKRDSLRPFHVLKYISDGFSQNYDYFFLMKDSLYVNARTLKYIVNKISVSQHLYMGTRIAESTFCSLDAGILISNSVLVAILDNLDWCIKNSFSDNHSENLGRCIAHSINLECQEEIQGQTIQSFRLRRHGVLKNMPYFKENPNFDLSAVVYPVITAEDIYSLHAYYSRLGASRVLVETGALSDEILSLGPKLPDNYKHISWPVGRRPGAYPTSRFDFPKHIYFNLTHKFFHSDFSNTALLTKSELVDIQNIINSIQAKVEKTSTNVLTYRRLINGYRVFDLSRGLDYTFDMAFKDQTTGKQVIKRFKVCKPLGNVEILPVPYVTENVRVTILLIVRENDIPSVQEFVDNYMKTFTGDKRQKAFLLFVLVYENESPSKGDTDVYKNVKNLAMKNTAKCGHRDSCKVAWLSIRLPVKSEIISDSVLRFAVIDLGLRKVGTDCLILVLDSGTIIDADFLNRVRMNTISNFQIFSPIPFKLFDPNLIESELINRKLDVHKSSGKFDSNEYRYISFYGKDYVNARLKSQALIPIIRNDRDIKSLTEIKISSKWNIFRLFIKFSEGIHSMRATDHGLKIIYRKDNKNTIPYASKTQLAKLILKYGVS